MDVGRRDRLFRQPHPSRDKRAARSSDEKIDISAQAVLGNGLSACRVRGQVVLWFSRPVALLDDMRENLGAIEARLAQFGGGSKLEGCVPDGVALNLSDQFVNFFVADDRPLRDQALGRGEAGVFASQLAQGFYHLAEQEGTSIPRVGGLTMSAIGSVSYRFEEVGSLSRVKWSSLP